MRKALIAFVQEHETLTAVAAGLIGAVLGGLIGLALGWSWAYPIIGVALMWIFVYLFSVATDRSEKNDKVS